MLTKELKKRKLTQERLKELLHYDPNTGNFIRKIHASSNAQKGDIAGSIKKDGYRRIGIDYNVYKSSRLAWLYMEGYFPENIVEHKNRIRHDDRWSNLREASHQCNMRNFGVKRNNKTGITGVSFNKKHKKWRSVIGVNKKRIFLGSFNEKSEAVNARWEAEKKYDFPNCQTTSSAYLYLKEHGCLKN